MRTKQAGLFLYFIVFAETARAACNLPVDQNPYLSFDDCPRLEWSDNGGVLSIADHGEAVWVDAAGVVHIARSLKDVPEPFLSMYAARHNQDGQLTFADTSPRFALGMDVADDASPRATSRMLQRQQWRDDIATWRMELYTSTRALLESVLNPPSAGLNPVAFAYPPSRVQVHEGQVNAVERARGRALHARHMLLDVMPQRARAEEVPPQWLQ